MSNLKKINLQYLFSYLGLFPIIFVVIDKYFFFKLKYEIYLDFTIYYSIVIFVFIGSTNWNLSTKIQNHIIIFGLLPSLLSVFIIVLNLYNYNSVILIILLSFLFILQLIMDYIFNYNKKPKYKVFYKLRLPLAVLVSSLLIIIII